MTAVSEEEAVNTIPSKMGPMYLKREQGFFQRNFPTDSQSFRVTVPVLGWVTSLLCFHVLHQWFLWRSHPDIVDCIAILAILTMMSGAAYQLHWGLKIGDRKQYTPWIILKAIENLLILISFLTNLRYLEYGLPVGILFAANCFLSFFIIRKSVRESRAKVAETAQEDEKIDKELHPEGSIYTVV